jgi:hypothetical protein
MTNTLSKLSQEVPIKEESTRECVICYESLSNAKNLCITECGHEFCFSCMMKHVQRNNGCPCCRATLIEEVESTSDSDSESEVDSDADSDQESDDSTLSEPEEYNYDIESFEALFVAKGYGLKDALSLFLRNFSKTDEKYTKAYIQQLEDTIDELDEQLDNEFREREDMNKEDAISGRVEFYTVNETTPLSI